MIYFLRYKWFYITLGFWFFISAFSAWALIFSSLQLKTKNLSVFSTKINGSLSKNEISVISAPMKISVDSLSENWKNEGWICVSGKTNLAALFFNLPKEYAEWIEPLIQLRVFRKNDTSRLLGLLSSPDHDGAYLWTAEISKNAIGFNRSTKIDFPLRPPLGAENVFTAKSDHLETLMWRLPLKNSVIDLFKKNYISQGFIGKVTFVKNDETYLLLQKGLTKLFAVVQKDSKNYVFYIVHQY